MENDDNKLEEVVLGTANANTAPENNNGAGVKELSDEDESDPSKTKTTKVYTNDDFVDENNHHDDEEDYDSEKYPMREVAFSLPFFSDNIVFNPVVSAIGVICLWGLSIWCMIEPEQSAEKLKGWRSDITLYYTWLFAITRAGFLFFLFYVAAKFGHVKMAKTDNEPPEFATGSYFMMIFAAGVAVGLFVYGVSEPLWHQDSHYYANAGYRSQDEIDMFAINMTVTNWGFAAWAPYLVVAVSMGLAGHRYGLPMTFRSCFYPILRDYTWGWIGDILDGFTIVTTVAGVCTSLGLGAITIVAGLETLGWIDDDLSESRTTTIQSMTIWCITAVATASVISGLHIGVQILSQIAFGLGMLLLFLVFSMDNTKYLLNLQVQEVGYYLQNSLVQINFWTDAFGQLREGEGRAIDGHAAAEWWQDAWPVFYQAWWVSWASFVGLFVARISRGRTVGEVIIYSLLIPVVYCIMWFCIWGGTGLRQARQAMELEELGIKYYNNSGEFRVAGDDFCYDVPQESVTHNGTVIFENHLKGITPVCQFNSNDPDKSAFNVLNSFTYPSDYDTGYGPTLSVIFIVALAIYFATSSDSGSLIVDHLASNGRMKHHWIQRFFWAVTEGAVATALLSAGGSDALSAVQAGSVVAGLPYVVMLTYLTQSIWIMCTKGDEETKAFIATGEEQKRGDSDDDGNGALFATKQNEFDMPIYGGVFNLFEFILSGGNVHHSRIEKNMHLPTYFQVYEFIKGVFLPFFSLYQILSMTYPRNRCQNIMNAGAYAVLFYLWIILFATSGVNRGIVAWSWAVYLGNSIILASIRNGYRVRYNIRSNAFGDFISCLFFWPQVLTQLQLQCRVMELNTNNNGGVEDVDNKD